MHNTYMTHTRPWLVFADDWGRHPSSCQHLVRELLPHISITWVNTIGTRPPRLDWGTLRRVGGKLKSWIGPKKTIAESQAHAGFSPNIISPKMWPSFKSSSGRNLNKKLLLRALKPIVDAMPEAPNIVTTLPLVADLIGSLRAHRWVYYCVDDFSVWPGYDGETMLKMEHDLAPKCDAIIAVSETLCKKSEIYHKPLHLLTHGVNLAHWRQTSTIQKPAELASLETPLIVYWGVIDRRTDTSFVQHLSETLSAGTILFVGPKEDPDPALFALPHVKWLPPWPFARLPELAAAADVLIAPYADMPATRAMQPLKLKEYLATGKPVVVRQLPATQEWSDCADLAENPKDFAEAVLTRIQSGLPQEQVISRQRLDAESWTGKAKLFEDWVKGAE